jgi:uncharacterized membrane protein YtjA (UPF0391 family)
MIWSLGFLALAILGAVFGLGGIATGAGTVARVSFFIVIAAWVASLFRLAVARKRTEVPP